MKNLKLSDQLDFGKYKNRTVKNIRENDPGYLVWCVENKIIPLGKKIDKELKVIFQEREINGYPLDSEHREYGDTDYEDFDENFYGQG